MLNYKLTGSDVMNYRKHKIKALAKDAFFNVLILVTLPFYLGFSLVKKLKKEEIKNVREYRISSN